MKASQIITKRKVNNIIIRQSVYTSSASLNDLASFRDFLFLLIATKQRLPIAQYPEERNASATANDRTGTLKKMNTEKIETCNIGVQSMADQGFETRIGLSKKFKAQSSII